MDWGQPADHSQLATMESHSGEEEQAMKDFETSEPEFVELGKVTVETKGQAIFQSDDSGGKLHYVTGIADD